MSLDVYIYLFLDVHNRSFDITLQRQCTGTDRLTSGGVHLPVVSVSLYMHWYFLIFSY